MKIPETPPRGRAVILALLLMVGIWPTASRAAQDPINISADRATYESGTGVYEGNVELQQGPLSIRAERLIIDEQNRQVDRILALGSPAVLTRSDGTVKAQANSIEYFVKSGRVILTDQALIEQQGSEIRGNRIVYDNTDQTVLAEGDKNTRQERVNMTLQPRREDEKTKDTEREP